MTKTIKKSTSKLKMLAVLVDQFLEAEIKTEGLLPQPDKIGQYRSLLEKNLWRGGTPDAHWKFYSDRIRIVERTEENPYIREDIEDIKEDLEQALRKAAG